MTIDWIFLDVGNVLLDEDRLSFAAFRHYCEAILAVRPDLTYRGLLDAFEAESGRSPWPLYAMASGYLDDDRLMQIWEAADREIRPLYGELSAPIPGVPALLASLRGFARLGLIANQPPEGRDWLERLGWLDRFEVVSLSGLEGVSKPDPRLFEIALDRAGADPSRCLMVGDRLDNDVKPAAALGMKTALVRWPRRSEKGWTPLDPEGIAYMESLERSAIRADEAWRGAGPTIRIDGLDGMRRLAEAGPTFRGFEGSRLASDRRS